MMMMMILTCRFRLMTTYLKFYLFELTYKKAKLMEIETVGKKFAVRVLLSDTVANH